MKYVAHGPADTADNCCLSINLKAEYYLLESIHIHRYIIEFLKFIVKLFTDGR